jgi:polar amino acid transport system substrate-binding protein
MQLPRPHIITLLLIGLFALCGMTTPARADAVKEVQIAIGLTKPPYIMGPGGTGLEYDIVAKALEVRGYRMVARSYPPARALALMRAGQLDGMVTVTEGIGGDGYFSDDYVTYQNVAITLASRGIHLASVRDLSAYSVAAFQNARYILNREFADTVSHHANYTEYPQQLTQNKLLFSGRVDVVVGDRLVFRYLNQQVEAPIDATQAVTEHKIFPPTPRKAVFRDAGLRDEFNAGLRTIRHNGTYAAILRKYRAYLAP